MSSNFPRSSPCLSAAPLLSWESYPLLQRQVSCWTPLESRLPVRNYLGSCLTQLPDSNLCGVSILILSIITDWCEENDCFCACQENDSPGIHRPPRKQGCQATGSREWCSSHEPSGIQKGTWLYAVLCSWHPVTSRAQVPSSTNLYTLLKHLIS